MAKKMCRILRNLGRRPELLLRFALPGMRWCFAVVKACFHKQRVCYKNKVVLLPGLYDACVKYGERFRRGMQEDNDVLGPEAIEDAPESMRRAKLLAILGTEKTEAAAETDSGAEQHESEQDNQASADTGAGESGRAWLNHLLTKAPKQRKPIKKAKSAERPEINFDIPNFRVD